MRKDPIVISLIGQYNSGKTTTAIQLRNALEFQQGLSVANVMFSKGINDLMAYWESGCDLFHYPLEAVKGKDVLESFIPKGYDAYILEGSYPHHPEWEIPDLLVNILGENQNEVIPSDEYNDHTKKQYPLIITKATTVIQDIPTVLESRTFLNYDKLKVVPDFHPSMELPVSHKKVIGIGYFPLEFFLIYPSLKENWYRFDYEGFFGDYIRGDYDLAIIGLIHKEHYGEFLGLDYPTLSYTPGTFIPDLCPVGITEGLTDEQQKLLTNSIRDVLLNQPRGTTLPAPMDGSDPTRYTYYLYSNPYWCYPEFKDLQMVTQIGDVTCLNGWVHPKYLIEDGIIQV